MHFVSETAKLAFTASQWICNVFGFDLQKISVQYEILCVSSFSTSHTFYLTSFSYHTAHMQN